MNFLKPLSHQASLRVKLIFLAGIPILILASLAAQVIYKARVQYQLAETAAIRILIAQNTSELIKEVQKERGKSATFAEGGLPFTEVEKQKELTEIKLVQLKSKLNTSQIDNEIKLKLIETFRKLSDFQNGVSSKDDKSTIVKNYSLLVGELTWFQMAVTHGIKQIDSLMRISLLEATRENAGLLRATISGFLASNQALTTSEISRLLNLRVGIESNFNSQALLSSVEITARIADVKNSQNWKTAFEMYQKVMDLSKVGKYGIEAKTFFDIMTGAVNAVGDIIDSEFRIVSNIVDQEIYTEKIYFYSIFFGMLILVVFILVVAILMIRSLTQSVNSVIKDLTEASNQLAGSSNQLSDASTQLSSSATESAASLEEIVASVEELASMVKLNTENSKVAAEISDKNTYTADKGDKDISLLIESMLDIQESSKKIEDIIGLIDDIAFQTNLLALNAAVEAARAGEQGKGFAVVADAVRTLAGRSATAAKGINSLIHDSVLKIENGTKAAELSGKSLKEIIDAVKKVAEINTAIAIGSDEQNSGLEQISKALHQLDQTTQNNAATSEEVSASALSLNDQSIRQNEILGTLNKIIHGV